MSNKRICFFLHYFPDAKIPLYVQYYLNELSQYFDEVRLITNKRKSFELMNVLPAEIKIQYVANEGYDFGMFYKGFVEINPDDYSMIACINDSNLLLNKLDFLFKNAQTTSADFWGLIDSHESPWFSNHKDSYHIQSHFLVFNKAAILRLSDYFNQVNPEKLIIEKNKKQLRRQVIHESEIGISQYLIKNGMKSMSIFNSQKLLNKYKADGQNATHSIYEELLQEGYPLLKKKILYKKRLKIFGNKNRIKKLIARYGNSKWNHQLALDEIL